MSIMFQYDDNNSIAKDADGSVSTIPETDAPRPKTNSETNSKISSEANPEPNFEIQRPDVNPTPGQSTNDLARGLALFSQIGISMAGCILLGVFLGRWLDERFGTSPSLLLLCTFFGVGAAFVSLNDLAKRSK